MQHLESERLAALADELPTAGESAHLACCLSCRRERDSYVALLALAQDEGRAGTEAERAAHAFGEPLTRWEEIAAALRADGLLTPGSDGPRGAAPAMGRPWVEPEPARRLGAPSGWRRPRSLARVAAAAALLVGGAGLGRLSAEIPLPGRAESSADAPGLLTGTSGAGEAAFAAAGAGTSVEPGAGDAASARGREVLTMDGTILLVSDAPFASVAEAGRVLARAQRDYQRAAAYLAEHDSSAAVGDTRVLRARLAALEAMMPQVREALAETPQDPVLNQVYLTTYDVRESTLRQLGRVLPVGAQLNGY